MHDANGSTDHNSGRPDEQEPFSVVGIGASAGGLKAFAHLVAALPPTSGMVVVLVQHFAPDHDDVLAELLRGHTHMAVVQPTDGMPVKRDHIYVVPAEEYLAIENGVLRLSWRPASKGGRLPFDFFLKSLAAAYADQAVAVVLTGKGGDGSAGLKAVKENGGFVIAQEPEDAEHAGMPRSAVMTGAVDLILPLDQIPEALVRGFSRSLPTGRERMLDNR